MNQSGFVSLCSHFVLDSGPTLQHKRRTSLGKEAPAGWLPIA